MKYFSRLGTKITLGVSFILVLILVVSATAFVFDEYAFFDRNIRDRAEGTLSILEAVHTQAMLHRGNKRDGNPVIETLNGTFDQLSETPSKMSLWLVMGSKVLAFQNLNGRSEKEPPRDLLDSQALATGQTVAQVVDGGVFRLTRPVILGKGNARHAKCMECHGKDMGIHKGEVIGAYSIGLSIADDQEQLLSTMRAAIIISVFASLVIAVVSSYLLKRLATGPIAHMTATMSQLANGALDVDVPFRQRRDEIGEMARSVAVFKENAIERNRAEVRARQHETELAHVLRRSTMGEMASGLAHELAQPLATIATYCGAISDRIASGKWTEEELTDVLGKISAMAQRASRITRTVADHVRGTTPHRRAIGVNDIVRSIIPLVEADTHAGDVQFDYAAVESNPTVLVNRTEIESVVLNLVRNAVDAMAEIPSGQKRLCLRTAVENSHAVIIVSDTGKGMKPGVLDRLFEPFFTTKPDGIGMGLAISRTIVEAHGGRFSVDSTPGRGTTFRFTLPVQSGDDRHDA